MSDVVNVSRRDFLAAGVMLGGLTLGVQLWSSAPARAKTSAATFAPDAFIRIGTDESVAIMVGRSEMGQGVYTSLPMLIAEELDADWNRVRVQSAPVARAYDNPSLKLQGTGGSSSVSTSWEPLRKAGAAARAMLVRAAASQWNVDAKSCRTENGRVLHEPSGRSVSYGALVPIAAELKAPTTVTLKSPEQFRLIGQPVPRLDIPDKTNGRAQFGIDVSIPGLLTAVVARPPMFGATLRKVVDTRALAVPGVRRVVTIDAGVAVVADSFWSASAGRDALEIDWSEGPLSAFDSDAQAWQYDELLGKAGPVAVARGDVDGGLARASKTIAADYRCPYIAHATMEPLNCVAHVRPDGCDVWVGTQFQTYDRNVAAEVAGLPPHRVDLHTMLLGGGFGRRGVPDGHFVREAAQVSKAVGAPVKVIWTRADDLRGGYYRPVYHHRLRAGIDESGSPTGWSHRVVGQSVLLGTPFESLTVRNGIDGSSVDTPLYDIPNLRVELHTVRLPVPVWSWRSVGSTHTGFVIESFVDELAHAAGRDPVEYRRGLLQPQHRVVLDLAARKAGWGSPLPPGRGRGIAIQQFDSIVAQVAEVSVDAGGNVRVHRVVCAIDCGTVVNPDTVRAQLEGGIAMGLSAALHERITFERGRVQQSSFADYPILRMSDMPAIEVHFVPSTAPPRGVGEAGVPPIAAAVTNAIFAATGKRIRELPIRR